MRFHALMDALREFKSGANDHTIPLVDSAHKFSMDPGFLRKEILDGAAEYVRELISHGVFPLPYDNCLFQFGPGGLTEYGGDGFLWVLVWKDTVHGPEDWRILFRVFQWFPYTGVVPAPAIGEIIPSGRGEWKMLGLDRDIKERFDVGRGRYMAGEGGLVFNDKFKDFAKDNGLSLDEKKMVETVSFESGAYTSLSIGFENFMCGLGLLSTHGVITEDVPAPKFINAQRVKKGKSKIYDYHLIKIDLSILKIPGVVGDGNSHASPRVHWRRGHVRRLASGAVTMVRPCIVGDVSKGMVSHDYVIAPSVA